MSCLTVSKFLCCIDLELGGVFIAFAGILLSIWELIDGKIFGNSMYPICVTSTKFIHNLSVNRISTLCFLT